MAPPPAACTEGWGELLVDESRPEIRERSRTWVLPMAAAFPLGPPALQQILLGGGGEHSAALLPLLRVDLQWGGLINL